MKQNFLITHRERIIINSAKSHFEAVTSTLALCGQLKAGEVSAKAITHIAIHLGISRQTTHCINENGNSKIYISFGNISGEFKINHPDGSLGDFVTC